jgi:predicted transcriptional regulator
MNPNKDSAYEQDSKGCIITSFIGLLLRKKDYRLTLVCHVVRVRKGAVQIRFEILEYLFYNRKPQPRTYVWRKATSLSYDDFLKHLSYLREKKLVKETDEGKCLLTEKGRNIYAELRKSLPSIL